MADDKGSKTPGTPEMDLYKCVPMNIGDQTKRLTMCSVNYRLPLKSGTKKASIRLVFVEHRLVRTAGRFHFCVDHPAILNLGPKSTQ